MPSEASKGEITLVIWEEKKVILIQGIKQKVLSLCCFWPVGWLIGGFVAFFGISF